MQLPTVAIVIVTADRPTEVRRCLEALRPQLAGDCEVIVTDASHDDATMKVVGDFPGVRYLRSSVRNMCSQRNLGIRAAGKEIIAFLDDDTIPQPGWLAALRQ